MAFCLRERVSALDSPILLLKRLIVNRIGPWGGDGAEGMGCREMSAELRADVLQCLGNSIQQKGMRRED